MLKCKHSYTEAQCESLLKNKEEMGSNHLLFLLVSL